jgi:hypothetical protein
MYALFSCHNPSSFKLPSLSSFRRSSSEAPSSRTSSFFAVTISIVFLALCYPCGASLPSYFSPLSSQPEDLLFAGTKNTQDGQEDTGGEGKEGLFDARVRLIELQSNYLLLSEHLLFLALVT